MLNCDICGKPAAGSLGLHFDWNDEKGTSFVHKPMTSDGLWVDVCRECNRKTQDDIRRIFKITKSADMGIYYGAVSPDDDVGAKTVREYMRPPDEWVKDFEAVILDKGLSMRETRMVLDAAKDIIALVQEEAVEHWHTSKMAASAP